MKINAHAKINLSLDILGRRRDGYHTLDSITIPISLCDVITLEKADEISLKITGNDNIPSDEHNIAWKAAAKLKDFIKTEKGAAITIEKHIPVGAGLGGESTDAAAVLAGLNKMWSCGLSRHELSEIGLTLGADVPFFISGGAARVRGIGEIITPINMTRQLYLAIVQPEFSLPTKTVFENYDKGDAEAIHPDLDAIENILSMWNVVPFDQYMGNALEPVSRKLCPAIAAAVEDLSKISIQNPIMTGSGSAVFVLSDCVEQAEEIAGLLKNKYSFCEAYHTVLRTLEITEE